MDEAAEDFNLQWEEETVVKQEAVIAGLENVQGTSYSNMTAEEIIANTDQVAAENLIYLAQDVMGYTETAELADDPSVECVTEEVITDDWVPGGQERVEVPLEHLTHPILDIKEDNDPDVPLPTDQDEYTAMRPWPCDFCSRRFRKKAALMNHMVAHQNDRPHACNLCGVRYVRKCDLMNHLKVHAFVPDNADSVDFEDMLENNQILKPKKKRGRRKKNPEPDEDGLWENMTSARTQQWQRRSRAPAAPPAPPSPPAEPPPPSPPPTPTDPSRPFVCRHCGVGFAREKALQSHSRVHGGDSPMECGACGELCWSREALAAHAAARHPHMPPRERRDAPEPAFDESDSGDDMDYRLSPPPLLDAGRGERAVFDTMRGPELFCKDCGVAFQRADLLRRHVAAAHSYKRRTSSSGTWAEHACEVCGDGFADALQLLAHAETHAERPRPAHALRMKRMTRGRTNSSLSNSSRQFPCRVCGKVFGSRSSQQIHIRIHTGERPYACRFCWKAFADGGTLRKHERIHTGEKPYECAVCPRAFNQRVVLREHVRSHHSAPDRRANGGPAYCCVVCAAALHSSSELVQHLIEHCDANTALKRQPQNGPRKYKRRRKVKAARSESPHDWERESASPPPVSRSPSPRVKQSPPPSPEPPSPPSPPERPRRRRKQVVAPRPRMIHTEETRVSTRGRRVTRRPADDLRAIRGQRSPTPRSLAPRSPAPRSPTPCSLSSRSPSPPARAIKLERNDDHGEPGPFKCEMCALTFKRRDALLLHVPVHI